MKLRRKVRIDTPEKYSGNAGLVFDCDDEALAQRLVKYNYCERVDQELPVDVEPATEAEIVVVDVEPATEAEFVVVDTDPGEDNTEASITFDDGDE